MVNTKAGVGLGVAVLALLGAVIYHSSLNLEFDLILPDGNSTHAILSSGNYTDLQNNVGIMTVTNLHNTQSKPTVNYCPLAEFIHEHQGSYNSKHVGNGTIFSATIPPKYCNIELHKVPEFGTITLLIMIISIITIITISRLRLKIP